MSTMPCHITDGRAGNDPADRRDLTALDVEIRAGELAKRISDDEWLDALIDALVAACWPTRHRDTVTPLDLIRAGKLRALREAFAAEHDAAAGRLIGELLRQRYVAMATEQLS